MKPSLLDTIPDPDTIRKRLGACVREAEVLRRMLRLAEQVAKLKTHSETTAPNRQEVAHTQ